MPSDNDVRHDFPQQPNAARIRIHEAGADRLVLDIPPGKHSGGLGCFTVLWNGFMAVFTTLALTAGFNDLRNGKEWLPLLFIAVFWLVGLGLAYAWTRLRFDRCFLLVDRDRAVLRKMFLGRTNQTELSLDETSLAQLTESYRQNEVPVYRITLSGVGGNPIHFGTSLEAREKDWAVDAINHLLQPTATVVAPEKPAELLCEACGTVIPPDAFHSVAGDAICPSCGHEQSFPLGVGSVTPSLEGTPLPEELPGIVTVLEDSPERLGLQLRLCEYSALRWIIAVFGLGFGTLWYSSVAPQFVGHVQTLAAGKVGDIMEWFFLLLLVPFLTGGAIPLLVGLFALGGRQTTWIDRETVKVRLHLGPFGRTWTMPTADVTEVRLIDNRQASTKFGNPRVAAHNPRVQGQQQSLRSAVICAGSRIFSMTAMHQPTTARFVVEKVRRWFRENMPELKV